MQIRCQTTFNITKTGTTGRFKPDQLPLEDHAGNKVSSLETWTRSRNQQRNLETIIQVLELRTQLFDLTEPAEKSGRWSFEFSVEFEGIFQLDQDIFGTLKQDCQGVPMLLDLGEKDTKIPTLITQGAKQNIWFELVP